MQQKEPRKQHIFRNLWSEEESGNVPLVKYVIFKFIFFCGEILKLLRTIRLFRMKLVILDRVKKLVPFSLSFFQQKPRRRFTTFLFTTFVTFGSVVLPVQG